MERGQSMTRRSWTSARPCTSSAGAEAEARATLSGAVADDDMRRVRWALQEARSEGVPFERAWDRVMADVVPDLLKPGKTLRSQSAEAQDRDAVRGVLDKTRDAWRAAYLGQEFIIERRWPDGEVERFEALSRAGAISTLLDGLTAAEPQVVSKGARRGRQRAARAPALVA